MPCNRQGDVLCHARSELHPFETGVGLLAGSLIDRNSCLAVPLDDGRESRCPSVLARKRDPALEGSPASRSLDLLIVERHSLALRLAARYGSRGAGAGRPVEAARFGRGQY